MRPTFVDIHYARTFPYDVARAYAWLTDYQDDDPARTTAVVKRRPVLERTRDKVVLEGELEIAGTHGVGKVEVDLHPPDRWVARVVEGKGKGNVFEYKLTPEAPDRTRLDVRYRIRVRRWRSRLKVWLAKGVTRRDLDRMWDGFASSMVKELGR